MLEKLKNIIINYVEVDKDEIKPESRFMEDLGFTSFDFMGMLGELEDEFEVEIDEQEELAEGFGLVGVPTFILYKDGEEKGRIIGYRMKAKFFEELEGLMK